MTVEKQIEALYIKYNIREIKRERQFIADKLWLTNKQLLFVLYCNTNWLWSLKRWVITNIFWVFVLQIYFLSPNRALSKGVRCLSLTTESPPCSLLPTAVQVKVPPAPPADWGKPSPDSADVAPPLLFVCCRRPQHVRRPSLSLPPAKTHLLGHALSGTYTPNFKEGNNIASQVIWWTTGR